MKQITLLTVLFLVSISFSSDAQTVYKVDEKRIYSWDGNPDWQQHSTQQYLYANGGNKESSVLILSYPGGEALYQDLKTYNTSNNIILEVTQFWNSTMTQWETTAQTVYTYNGSGKIEFETDQSYNFVTQMYTNAFRTKYDYSGDNLIRITYQSWENGAWENDDKFEYAYNTSGLPIEEIESIWNSATMLWEPSERGIATYTNNLLTKLEIYKYDNGGWETQPFEQYLTEYTGMLESSFTWQSWNGSQWVNEDIETSFYDTNGNRTEYIFSSWSGSDWEPYYKEESDYSEAAPLSVTSFDSEDFKVYPNPASDVINIASKIPIDKIELYSILGSKILQSDNYMQINVSHVKSGMYLVKATSGSKTTSKRIVIK
jgi:hypothetical protein